MKNLAERLHSPAPKRILSLDHGEVSDILSSGILERIEEVLAKENNDPDFRISDFFDLIGSTGSGSMIAAALAIGMKVSEIKQKLIDAQPTAQSCKSLFGDITFGDSRNLRTGLCIFSKQGETNNILEIHNHPDGKYFNQYKDQTLSKIVQDGIANSACLIDPSFRLFLLAGQHSSPFHWKLGTRNMLIVSIDTGSAEHDDREANMNNEMIMQLLGDSPDENHNNIQPRESFLGFKAFTYLKYDAAKNVSPDHFNKFLNKHPVRTDGIFFVSGTHYDLPFESYTKKDIPIGACRIDSDFEIMTMEGLMKAKAGDYLIKGVRGEYYACDAEVFKETYARTHEN